jgi:hypothetical protein
VPSRSSRSCQSRRVSPRSKCHNIGLPRRPGAGADTFADTPGSVPAGCGCAGRQPRRRVAPAEATACALFASSRSPLLERARRRAQEPASWLSQALLRLRRLRRGVRAERREHTPPAECANTATTPVPRARHAASQPQERARSRSHAQ